LNVNIKFTIRRITNTNVNTVVIQPQENFTTAVFE